MTGALQRYRVLAVIAGIAVIVLLLVAVPLRYLADEPWLSEHFSQVHGLCYLLFVAATADLSRRAGWSVRRTVLVALAGTVPFLSFVVERRMTREVQARLAS